MTIKPIKTKKAYNVALAKIDKLLTSAPDTKKAMN